MNSNSTSTQIAQGGSGIARAFWILGTLWGGVIASAVIALFAVPPAAYPRYAALAVFVVGTFFVLRGVRQLFSAKAQVLNGGEVSLWKGTVKLVSWNPTEGVLFLKDKHINYVDSNPHDGGGIRAFFPHLGEELALRIPLEIQTLSIEDKQVLTKELIPLTIRGTMYWKVTDLTKFYLLLSKEIHFENDTGKHAVRRPDKHPKMEVAEFWLRSMAGEKTRAVVQQWAIGVFVAGNRSAAEIPHGFQGGGAGLAAENKNVNEGLARAIFDEFAPCVHEYGLELHRVALQEVEVPIEVSNAARAAAASSVSIAGANADAIRKKIMAEADAAGRKMMLEAEADVIGKDAVGNKEILGAAPALSTMDAANKVLVDAMNRKNPTGVMLPVPVPVAPPPLPKQ